MNIKTVSFNDDIESVVWTSINTYNSKLHSFNKTNDSELFFHTNDNSDFILRHNLITDTFQCFELRNPENVSIEYELE